MFHPLKSQYSILVFTDSVSKLLTRRYVLVNIITLSFPSKLTSHCSWHSILKITETILNTADISELSQNVLINLMCYNI